jgi:hypothetical protein
MKKLLLIIVTFSFLFSDEVNLQARQAGNHADIFITSSEPIYGFQLTLPQISEEITYNTENYYYGNGHESVETSIINPIEGLVNDYDFICFMDSTYRLMAFSLDGMPIPPIEEQTYLISIELNNYFYQHNFTVIDPVFIGMDENNNLIELEVEYGLAEYQDGWPFYTEQQVASSPAVIDIDGDGEKEVIFADYSGWVHIIDRYGEAECHYNTGNQVWGAPAIADIDGDGELEIVINSKSKKMIVLNSECDEEMVYDADQYLMGTPALGNIDDDSDLEIIFGGYSSPGKIFAVNPDGSDVEGFPFELGEKVQAGVAIADVNGNGKVDIVCGTDDGNLYLIYDNAEIADGFPFVTGDDIRTAPTIYANDDMNEPWFAPLILTGSKDNNFYIINIDGSLNSVIETAGDISVSNSMINLYDEFGMITFFGSESGLVYDSDMNSLELSNSIDIGEALISSPIHARLGYHIGCIFATQNNIYVDKEYAYYHGLRPEMLQFESDNLYASSMCINDIDNDGDYEIIIGTTHGVDVIDVKNDYNQSYTHVENEFWNMYRGNYERTGFFHSNAVASINDDNIPDRFAINKIYPNPFNPTTVINYQLKSNCKVSLDIYNINGQLVEQLVNTNQNLGHHEMVWDASNFSTGVYFVKLRAGGFSETQKLMLVK